MGASGRGFQGAAQTLALVASRCDQPFRALRRVARAGVIHRRWCGHRRRSRRVCAPRVGHACGRRCANHPVRQLRCVLIETLPVASRRPPCAWRKCNGRWLSHCVA